MAGHGRKLGHQLLEQLECAAEVFFGRREVADLAIDPATSVDGQRELVADLGLLGVGGVCPLQLGDALVKDWLGLRETPVEPEQVGLALQGLAQAKPVFGRGGRVFLRIGQNLLRRERLLVKDIRLPGVGSAADQKIPQ